MNNSLPKTCLKKNKQGMFSPCCKMGNVVNKDFVQWGGAFSQKYVKFQEKGRTCEYFGSCEKLFQIS